MENDKPFQYVIVAGRGRSGTHWLTGTLDLSPVTHCRFEPDRVYGRFFEASASQLGAIDANVDMASVYDANMSQSAKRVGFQDLSPTVEKVFAVRPARYARARHWLTRRRLRVAASTVVRDLRGLSWSLPDWLTGGIDWDRAVPVIKVHQIARGARWIVENRKKTAILHIVRHPCGFLQSWEDRWLSRHDQSAALEVGRRRLQAIADEDPAWKERLRAIDDMTIQETELWYWRVFNELNYRAGADSSSYRLVRFEEFADQPVQTAESLYTMCGLNWTDSIRAHVMKNAEKSLEIAHRWRDRLDPWKVEMAERVLRGSCMEQWWSMDR